MKGATSAARCVTSSRESAAKRKLPALSPAHDGKCDCRAPQTHPRETVCALQKGEKDRRPQWKHEQHEAKDVHVCRTGPVSNRSERYLGCSKESVSSAPPFCMLHAKGTDKAMVALMGQKHRQHLGPVSLNTSAREVFRTGIDLLPSRASEQHRRPNPQGRGISGSTDGPRSRKEPRAF